MLIPVQVLLDGFINGCTIAIFALAFAMVYLPTRTFHVALAGIYVATPFLCLKLFALGWHPVLAVGGAIAAGGVISAACEYFNHQPLERKGGSAAAHLISSLGIYIVILQMITLTWGYETRLLRLSASPAFLHGRVIVTHTQAVAAFASIALCALFFFWLFLSNFGLQFRALAENPKELALRGYDIAKLRLIAFTISGMLASMSSLLVANDLGFSARKGLPALLLAIVATIIGGRLSFSGPVLGALLVGVTQSFTILVLSPQWVEVVTFLLLSLFLIVRPAGLIARKRRLEAEADA